jgi:hypothetical protein
MYEEDTCSFTMNSHQYLMTCSKNMDNPPGITKFVEVQDSIFLADSYLETKQKSAEFTTSKNTDKRTWVAEKQDVDTLLGFHKNIPPSHLYPSSSHGRLSLVAMSTVRFYPSLFFHTSLLDNIAHSLTHSLTHPYPP